LALPHHAFLHDVLQLDLKEEAVRIAPVTHGIPFLGFRIFPELIRLEGKKWARFRRGVRALEAQYACAMIDEATLACSVASMIGHVMHADSLAARRAFFAESLSLG
jgi:hypothetical protein